MQAVDKDLMAMKVTELKEELKEELAARDEALSGNKAWLRWRLHTAIVRTHVEARADGRGQLPTRANRAIGYSSGDRPLPVPGSERCSTCTCTCTCTCVRSKCSSPNENPRTEPSNRHLFTFMTSFHNPSTRPQRQDACLQRPSSILPCRMCDVGDSRLACAIRFRSRSRPVQRTRDPSWRAVPQRRTETTQCTSNGSLGRSLQALAPAKGGLLEREMAKVAK